MQSITTLVSLDHALAMAREAVAEAVKIAYPDPTKVYVAHLNEALERRFREPD